MKIAGPIVVCDTFDGPELTAIDPTNDPRFAWGVIPEIEITLRLRVRASRMDDVKALVSLIEDTEQ